MAAPYRACAGSARRLGASVATRLFIDAAATPPLQGGECAPLNSSLKEGSMHRTKVFPRFFTIAVLLLGNSVLLKAQADFSGVWMNKALSTEQRDEKGNMIVRRRN